MAYILSDKDFYPTLNNACYCLSTMELKLTHDLIILHRK